MSSVSPDRLGLCSWSCHPQGPEDLIARLRDCGLTRVQLALDPIRCDPLAWADVATKLAEGGITLASGMIGAAGEDYTTPQTIRQTGGLVPDQTWEENKRNIAATVPIAAALGLKRVSGHAGFIPPEVGSEAFDRLVGRVQHVCDAFQQGFGGEFLLETGQETADTLAAFLQACDRPNLGVNFDPANMLLYAMGDPITSLKKVLPRVRQVHIKDGIRPETPGTWGQEVAIGQGQVDWNAFIGVLQEAGYDGDLIIEREAGADRVGDIRTAIAFLSRFMKGA